MVKNMRIIAVVALLSAGIAIAKQEKRTIDATYNVASITPTGNPLLFDLGLKRIRGECVPETVLGSIQLIPLCAVDSTDSFAWQARFTALVSFLKPFKCPPTVVIGSENAIPTLAVPLGYAFLAQRDAFNVTAYNFNFAISIVFASCPQSAPLSLFEMTQLILAFRRDDVNLNIIAVS